MKHKKIITASLGGLLGAIGGYAYYFFIGCQGGICPITSNPYISTIYGMIIGSILFNLFSQPKSQLPK